ncbi:Hypothetical protein A7982_01782 [Minicystis rosea]|nr:Hypothetical protein A7982_01782 [Minicystis rosea]
MLSILSPRCVLHRRRIEDRFTDGAPSSCPLVVTRSATR